ncbi:SDR family NAD(P)-dependent oxidoreductase [Aquiluna sp. KACHI24]|uniref:SDR family NAD(P)-dependent oxidoreductase n=1 Tax=Aquiluna sp. KACHI24 TaxID=2968831 RepID=UPI00220452EF|nr:SDR family NAD(P)-dependent oxidoreductase [Aquiluna sp. KACHI24]BDQ00540.1 UDP-glucose 4-epimerase [Aquiluna sp. KACHI24]
MTQKIDGSTVLITGGTGSFGSTMARHLLTRGVEEVRILSRDEAKQDAMRHALGDSRVKFYIGDTRDPESVERAVRGSNLIFHAAALKQVPSAEFFPLEAVKTNINGSANVLRSAIENEVSGVVCLSTDKAVYPINAMGMSKALMEKTAMAFARDYQDSKTTIAVTRYGNVMYSRGSVIPLFISQIKSGKPVTITDPTMTRFLMSLAESVDLVEYAFSNAETGDLFVRKAPASTIQDLAIALIEMFGGNANQIQNIGFRHGEKLYESLLSVEERVKAEDRGGYFRVPLDARDLNYSLFFEQGESRAPELESYTSHNTERLDVEGVKQLLLTIPEVRQELAR